MAKDDNIGGTRVRVSRVLPKDKQGKSNVRRAQRNKKEIKRVRSKSGS